ncbi:hypothetical protein D5S17_15260 [Pseudonocardiaceae bacterium YIM PH 21723]|nr:hypothetical protein D5S17_15260 [Pseudonocardiaceae bacterium YIM PH 21723]
MMTELTPYERMLLAEPAEVRGYTPRDGIAEPDAAPDEAAGASARPAEPEAGSPSNVDVTGP